MTNGNAFTAAIVEDQIRMLLPRVSAARQRSPHIAIVGASGSVGTAVTRLLARDPAGARLTLIARTAPRLERSPPTSPPTSMSRSPTRSTPSATPTWWCC